MTQTAAVGDTQTALAGLGVDEDTLTGPEKARLDEDSCLLLEGLMDDDWLEAARARLEEVTTERYGARVSDRPLREGATMLMDVVSEGEVFERMYTHPRLLAAVHRILRSELILHSVNTRTTLPGTGRQHLHSDVGARVPAEPFRLVNSAWLLDPFTEENGPTRLVPGSHELPGAPRDYVDPWADHPDQITVHAPAGSVFVFNCNLWHSSTVNRSGAPRRVVHCATGRRDFEQSPVQREVIRKSTWDRLSPAARYLLDV